jgi:exo-poly-alpha-galacturonosidase
MKKYFYFLFFTVLFNSTVVKAQITDVWDFGATQLDTNLFNNLLNETTINSWYASTITPGSVSTSNVMPVSFTAGALSWSGGTSDRLRTINTLITRYDNNVASVTTHNGRIYCNANATVAGSIASSRYLGITLAEDDEVKVIARGDTAGLLTFAYVTDPNLQKDNVAITTTSGSTTEANYVAKYAGAYRIYDATSKASFYRIFRKAATYLNLSGNVNVTQAPGIPSGYSIVYTNAAGKSWSSVVTSGSYNVRIPVGYSYQLSLVNANGFVISNGLTFNSTGITTPTATRDITIIAVDLYTVTGTITGLGTSISNLNVTFTPATSRVYVPVPVINSANSTYSVQLEPNIQYIIAPQGVNDYEIPANTITILAANTSANIVFTPKPVFPITINATGLNVTQLASLNLTFTNLNESGYVYNFSTTSPISLRNGTYSVSYSGLDNFPVELGLVSNLTVNGVAVTKTLAFRPVTVWSFEDRTISTSTSASYKGMLLTGQVTTVPASGHLTAKTGATIRVPVNPGESITVAYYYTANFSIEGGTALTTATNSTTTLEYVSYTYTGTTAGYVNILVGGASTLTTYFPEIKVGARLQYTPTLTVGVDKQFQTINGALQAVANMTRVNNDRVTILIDPGNYEEMIVIKEPNITLKNASLNPNTNLIDKGVNIAPGAVRITSYYGVGYNYYSMGTDQKWNQDVLNVNRQNGYTNYQNVSGTTNGSYWNATVVVNANGFQADDIIIENSFNQYISNKESQDVLVMWTSGSPGLRPTVPGNTGVQSRTLVERAAAIAVPNNIDKVILNKCRIVGRQDSFFGGAGARVVVYKGDIMGAVDYIFGGMDVVFYKSNLSMNVSDASNDQAYITAAQQSSGRGFLMYQCTVTSAVPQVESASVYRAKPGYFGRPWAATTSEVVFYNTTIETSNSPGYVGQSLIMPLGWQNTLGGNSAGMYEYGTVELSGVNNTPSRATWSTSLTTPALNDGTAISTFNFTKGTDNWDPLTQLIANEALITNQQHVLMTTNAIAYKNTIAITNVKTNTEITIFDIKGVLVKKLNINSDTNFTMPSGLWILKLKSDEGFKSYKLVTY